MRKIIFASALPVILFLSIAWIDGGHDKLIKFSHKFHVKESMVECTVCHYKAPSSTLSGDDLTGDHESCKTCHEEVLENNCNYCHVNPDDIRPIPNPERHLIFSHERHAAKSIECVSCHSGLEEALYASPANMPLMELCVDCHGKKQISNDCNACHTDLLKMIPKGHLEGEFRKDHKRQARIGGTDAGCSSCHEESYCQNCHAGIGLQKFGSGGDYLPDPAPRIQLKDSPKESKLQQVHDMNYRYTHAADARSRRLDCNSCHEQSAFCAECHQAGGGVNQMKIKPLNHSEPGFKLFTKGSGGGSHAKLAERDIEYCASCHDVEGADPTCMMCHTEKVGE